RRRDPSPVRTPMASRARVCERRRGGAPRRRTARSESSRPATRTPRRTRASGRPPLRVVEAGVFRVWGLSGGSAAEVTGRADDDVALHGEQLDEPRLVLDLFVQDPRSHVIGARILAEGD